MPLSEYNTDFIISEMSSRAVIASTLGVFMKKNLFNISTKYRDQYKYIQYVKYYTWDSDPCLLTQSPLVWLKLPHFRPVIQTLVYILCYNVNSFFQFTIHCWINTNGQLPLFGSFLHLGAGVYHSADIMKKIIISKKDYFSIENDFGKSKKCEWPCYWCRISFWV